LDVVMKAKATITMIKEQSRYISLMKEKINTLQNNVQKARIEMEQKQNALTEAHIEVKKIERLIALREQEQKELLQKQEMSFMDEISMHQFQKQRQNRSKYDKRKQRTKIKIMVRIRNTHPCN